MATIMCLPDEVITIILGCKYLSTQDIMNFKCMWEQFRPTAKKDIDWERIFSKRWPSAKRLYDKQSKENEQKDSEKNEQKDKKSLNFIETGINCARLLRGYVLRIMYKHYYTSFSNCDNNIIDNDINFKHVLNLDEHLEIDEIDFNDIMIYAIDFNDTIIKLENSIKYSFFIDEIKNLLTQSPRRTGCDLTERYYNTKILHYMRHCSIYEKMLLIMYKSERNHEKVLLMERIATIMAQYIQLEKDVFYSCVEASLDSIVLGVLNCLREKHPDHSIFSTSAETFSYWKNNNIENNHWNEAEGTQIIDTLNEYIFDKLNFRPSKLEDPKFEYICINNVLKNKYGQKIILYIIYHSVARRLGLCCNLIWLPERFICLYWKPDYATNSLEKVRCFTICSKKFPDCLVNQMSLYRTLYSEESSPYNIGVGLMWLEIGKLFAYSTNRYNKPFGINWRKYDRRYMIHRKLMLSFKNTEQLNTRPEDVKYSVGMIVTHNDEPTCAGVIIGWHRHIDTHVTFSLSDPFVDLAFTPDRHSELPLKHCSNLNFITQQTNYLILTENNKMCYVGEDHIILTTPKWIDNSEIGRYFCKFEGKHYVPNPMLARLYPQDAAITAQT